MHTFKIIGKSLIVTGAVLMLAMPVMAGNGKGSGQRSGSGSQDRLRDGSCLDATSTQTGSPLMAADRIQKKDKLKDGSCSDAVETNNDLRLMAGDQLRIKDMIKDLLQDGSCLDQEA